MQNTSKSERRKLILRLSLFIILILATIGSLIAGSFFVDRNAKAGPITGGTYEAIVQYKNTNDVNNAVSTLQNKVDPLVKKRMDVSRVGSDKLSITVPKSNYDSLTDFLRDIERRGSFFFLNDKGEDLLVGSGKGKEFKTLTTGDNLERIPLKDLIEDNSFQNSITKGTNNPMVQFKVRNLELFQAIFNKNPEVLIWTDIGQMLDEMRNNYSDLSKLRDFMKNKLVALKAGSEKNMLQQQLDIFFRAQVINIKTNTTENVNFFDVFVEKSKIYEYFTQPNIYKIKFNATNNSLMIDVNEKTDIYSKQRIIGAFRPYLKELVDTFNSNKYNKYLINDKALQPARDSNNEYFFTVNGEEKATGLAKIMNAGVKGIAFNAISFAELDSAISNTWKNVTIIAMSIILILALTFLTISYRLMGVILGLILALIIVTSMILYNALLGIYGWEVFIALLIGLVIAVSSSIILLERMREEYTNGKSLYSSFKDANRKSMSTVFDISILTFVISMFIYWMGIGIIKSFAIMLIISTLSSVILGIFLIRLIFYTLLSLSWVNQNQSLLVTNLDFLRKKLVVVGEKLAFNRVSKFFHKINFQKAVKWFVLVSLIVITCGAIVVGTVGGGRSLEFQPGTIYEVNVPRSSNSDDAKSIEKQLPNIRNQIIAKYGKDIVSVDFFTGTDNSNYIIIKTKAKIASFSDWLRNSRSIDRVNDIKNSSLINQTSSQLLIQGLIVIAISIAILLLYLIIRFDWSFIIPMFVTVIHDVLLVSAFLVLSRLAVNIEIIIAVLGVMLFSIINKIIVFDRVRENRLGLDKDELKKPEVYALINNGFKMTLRSILMTLSIACLMLVGLFIFGYNIGAAFVLLLGFMITIYSSTIMLRWLWTFFAFIKLSLYKKRKARIYRNLNAPDEQIIPGINS